MEPADEAVRTAVFGKYTLTEEQKKKLTNQLIIEVHFALSLIAMLFAHLLMYKMTEGSKHFLTFIAAGIFIVSMLETKYYKKAVLLGAAFLHLVAHALQGAGAHVLDRPGPHVAEQVAQQAHENGDDGQQQQDVFGVVFGEQV